MIVWLASYPRSGNTFLRIVLHRHFQVPTYSRYGDRHDIAAHDGTARAVGHEMLPRPFDWDGARRSRRLWLIKTHEPTEEQLRAVDRVIYVVRDGREATASQLRYFRSYARGDFSLQDILVGRAPYGSWAAHVRSWLPVIERQGTLVRFTDLVERPSEVARAIGDWLGRDTVDRAIPDFAELKALNPRFFGTARGSSWREVFDEREHLLFWHLSRDVMEALDFDVPPARLGQGGEAGFDAYAVATPGAQPAGPVRTPLGRERSGGGDGG